MRRPAFDPQSLWALRERPDVRSHGSSASSLAVGQALGRAACPDCVNKGDEGHDEFRQHIASRAEEAADDGACAWARRRAADGARRHRAEAGDAAENAKKILEFDARNITPSKAYRIAYLTECGQNPYCSARRAGLEAAAQKYGFTYKRFAANFNPATQIKQVQNAITEGFDGYLFAPTAAAAEPKVVTISAVSI